MIKHQGLEREREIYVFPLDICKKKGHRVTLVLHLEKK
jgi:hypothetical protein